MEKELSLWIDTLPKTPTRGKVAKPVVIKKFENIIQTFFNNCDKNEINDFFSYASSNEKTSGKFNKILPSSNEKTSEKFNKILQLHFDDRLQLRRFRNYFTIRKPQRKDVIFYCSFADLNGLATFSQYVEHKYKMKCEKIVPSCLTPIKKLKKSSVVIYVGTRHFWDKWYNTNKRGNKSIFAIVYLVNCFAEKNFFNFSCDKFDATLFIKCLKFSSVKDKTIWKRVSSINDNAQHWTSSVYLAQNQHNHFYLDLDVDVDDKTFRTILEDDPVQDVICLKCNDFIEGGSISLLSTHALACKKRKQCSCCAHTGKDLKSHCNAMHRRGGLLIFFAYEARLTLLTAAHSLDIFGIPVIPTDIKYSLDDRTKYLNSLLTKQPYVGSLYFAQSWYLYMCRELANRYMHTSNKEYGSCDINGLCSFIETWNNGISLLKLKIVQQLSDAGTFPFIYIGDRCDTTNCNEFGLFIFINEPHLPKFQFPYNKVVYLECSAQHSNAQMLSETVQQIVSFITPSVLQSSQWGHVCKKHRTNSKSFSINAIGNISLLDIQKDLDYLDIQKDLGIKDIDKISLLDIQKDLGIKDIDKISLLDIQKNLDYYYEPDALNCQSSELIYEFKGYYNSLSRKYCKPYKLKWLNYISPFYCNRDINNKKDALAKFNLSEITQEMCDDMSDDVKLKLICTGLAQRKLIS